MVCPKCTALSEIFTISPLTIIPDSIPLQKFPLKNNNLLLLPLKSISNSEAYFSQVLIIFSEIIYYYYNVCICLASLFQKIGPANDINTFNFKARTKQGNLRDELLAIEHYTCRKYSQIKVRHALLSIYEQYQV